MKQETEALLIVGGGFALLALTMFAVARPSSGSSSKNAGTGALPTGRAITRESCLECVEKHLGAAMVLITEVRDGYTEHRLRAVGHLHEAEDESQAFPALHDAIRAARKGYQQHGEVPNFGALTQLVTQAVATQAA